MDEVIKRSLESASQELTQKGHRITAEHWEQGENAYSNACVRCGRFASFSPESGRKAGTAFDTTCSVGKYWDWPREIPTTGEILLVDTEEEIRRTIASMLTDVGYKCEEFSSAAEALKWLETRETNVALILSEVPMDGGIDGIGLLEHVKDNYPTIPVVIVTKVHHLGVALAAFRRGAFDYLPKPFGSDLLLATVRRALASRTSENS
jgi:CheY-like chemotaxis protein